MTTNPDGIKGFLSNSYIGATATASFAAELPIPIKLCKLSEKFYLSEQKLSIAYESRRIS
jgi:hypothetical protein